MRALYEDAGSPSYQSLVAAGLSSRRHVRLKKTSLHEWINGVTVPADPIRFAFLVERLTTLAVRNPRRRPPAPLEPLRRAAVEERRRSRGRPATGPSKVLGEPPSAPSAPSAPTSLADWANYGGAPGPPRQLLPDIHGFVGREMQLLALETLLCRDDRGARIVVVAGTAGVGKTALVTHLAHRIRGHFPDGQLFVNLRGYDSRPVLDHGTVLDRFLRVLGVPEPRIPDDPEERADLYRTLLADKRMLVVLDNASDAEQVRTLLPSGPGCRSLVTTRARLTSLGAREGAHRHTLERLDATEAAHLIHAATARHRHHDDPDQVAELTRLCARLPLALRIAAERAAARPWMPLHELIADLREASTLWETLTTEDTDDDTVRTVLTWSYRSLPSPAGRAFRLLGLLPPPGFDATTAASLIDEPLQRARAVLDALVGAHLLEQTAPDWFQFHDLLRAYAADRARHVETAEAIAAALARLAVTTVTLPRETTTFVGRGPELAWLDELALNTCRAPATTVVLINGMAGSGKSTLAIHAAHGAAALFPDTRLWINLRGRTADREPLSPGEALEHLLRALGVPSHAIPEHVEERAFLYRARLAGTRTLIVLDDALDEGQVRHLLPDSPGCLTLVTSRTILRPSDGAHMLLLEVPSPDDAANLLITYAGRAGTVESTDPAVREVVDLCGQLPLALCLAAGFLRNGGVETFADLAAGLLAARLRLD
ncbi:NB-ARC domain-containing protein [Streptomyces sp. SID3343]|uniref:NB-ARC domain-containing protein n=1 Tax=Streptomyces sp. SID3343 TaxID=2690260 RepID=UPI001367EBFD|nr:NB-ARC domain-containing protein [Streptomyces sp. SID3343]